jgi:hypothetical protein
MHRVIRSGEIEPSPGGTVTFEGEPYGSGVSFFLVNNEPGTGPDLHKFKNIGTERLDIICIHASPRMIQVSLEE